MIPSAAHWARQPHENQQHQQERTTTNNSIGLLGSAACWQVSASSDHIQQQQGADWARPDQSPYNHHLQHHIEAAIKAQQQQPASAAWGDQSGITTGWDNPMILATAQSHHHHNSTQEHHYHPGLQLVQEGRQQQQEAAANKNIILQAEPLTAAASSQLSRHYEALLANNPALSSSVSTSSTIWPAALLSASTEGGLRSGDHHEGPVAGNSGGSYNGFHNINGLVNGAAGGAPLHGSCSNGHGSNSSAPGGGGSLSLYDASGHGSFRVSNSTTTSTTTASRLYDASCGHGASSANTGSTSTTSSEQDAAARLVNLLGLGASLEDQGSRLQGLMAVAKGTPLSPSTDHHHHRHQQHHHQLSDQFSTRIGLNLGGRTYFSASDELQLQAHQPDHGGHSGFIMQLGGYGGRFSAGAGGKRSFSMIRHGVPGLVHTPAPSCQADGCKADLALAKPYHRRHKVCASHSKAPSVSIAGQTQRFCQQCSRFHGLLEFDDVKRSCRKRLADHNRRRRKPQPTPLTTSNISPSNTNNNAPAAAAAASAGLPTPMASNNNTSTAPAVAEHADDHAKLTISGPDDDDQDDDDKATVADLQGGRPYKDEKEEQWSMLPSGLPLARAGACVDPEVNDHPTTRHVASPQPHDGGHPGGAPGPRLSLTSTEERPGGSPRAGTRGASWTPEWLRRGSSPQEDGDIMDVVSRSPPTKEGIHQANDKSLGLGTAYTSNNGMKSFGLEELRFSQNRSTSLGPWKQHDIIG